MPLSKLGVTHFPQTYMLNCLATYNFLAISAGAGAVSSTVSTNMYPGVRYKIAKVGITFSAIDAVDGSDTFNLVIGGQTGQTGQTYLQGNPAPSDNSYTFDPTQPIGNSNLGYPTNIAVAGQTVFANDIPFSSAANMAYPGNPNGQPGNLQGMAQPNTGWVTIATGTGGQGIFVPTNYDAMYPETQPISVRFTTNASTGNIAAVRVTMILEICGHRQSLPPGQTVYSAVPGQDF